MKKNQFIYAFFGLLLLIFTSPLSAQINLEVDGGIKLVDGTEDAGKVLTSDTAGVASWQDAIGRIYALGDFAQGGIVVWVDETGQHGIVCAKEDQSASMRWYAGTNTNTMAIARGPLAGEMSTTLIVANQGMGDGAAYAALLCSTTEVTEGGKTYGDWYLPSWDIIQLMYAERVMIDGTAALNGGTAFVVGDIYWSSYEFNDMGAMGLWFAASGGGPDFHGKNETLRVRAVRRF